MMKPQDKANLLGLFYWLFTAFNVVLIAVVGVIYVAVLGLVFSNAPHKASDPTPEVIVTIVAAVFIFALAFTVLFSVPKIVAGYGLRKNKPWARTWAIVAAVMCCLSFPFGTAIGVFGLIFLLSDEGKAYFASASYRQMAPANVAAPAAGEWR